MIGELAVIYRNDVGSRGLFGRPPSRSSRDRKRLQGRRAGYDRKRSISFELF